MLLKMDQILRLILGEDATKNLRNVTAFYTGSLRVRHNTSIIDEAKKTDMASYRRWLPT